MPQITLRQPSFRGKTQLKDPPQGIIPVKVAATGIVNACYLNTPFIKTVVATFAWSVLEPAMNVFDFSAIDTEINRVTAVGKTLILRILTNYLAPNSTANPDWLWAAGGGPCYQRAINDGVNTFNAYEPWDTCWQGHYANLMGALAARYDKHPAIRGIVVTGYNMKYSELVTRNDNNAINWDNTSANTNIPYTDAEFEMRIKETIVMMMSLWKHTLIMWRGVNLNVPRGRSDRYTVYDEIAKWAIPYGERLSIGSTSLQETDGADAVYLRIKTGTPGVRHHFQVGKTTPPVDQSECTTIGTLAIAAHAHHCEVGAADFQADDIASSANNGGLIRITTATTHGLITNDWVYVVGHGQESANGRWQVTVATTKIFDLQLSTYVAVGGATGYVYFEQAYLGWKAAAAMPWWKGKA